MDNKMCCKCGLIYDPIFVSCPKCGFKGFVFQKEDESDAESREMETRESQLHVLVKDFLELEHRRREYPLQADTLTNERGDLAATLWLFIYKSQKGQKFDLDVMTALATRVWAFVEPAHLMGDVEDLVSAFVLFSRDLGPAFGFQLYKIICSVGEKAFPFLLKALDDPYLNEWQRKTLFTALGEISGKRHPLFPYSFYHRWWKKQSQQRHEPKTGHKQGEVPACSVCGKALEYLGGPSSMFSPNASVLGANQPALEQWRGLVCIKCGQVYCVDCVGYIDHQPRPCPKCGAIPLPATRLYLHQVGIL